MAWICIHCGTQIYGNTSVCPNCEENPFESEPDELFIFNPKKIGEFVKTGKVKKRKLNLNIKK